MSLLKDSESVNRLLRSLSNLEGQMAVASWQRSAPLAPGTAVPKPVPRS